MSKDLINKLIRIQKLLKAPKNQFNKFGNYHYRNAEDIIEAVKPLLHEKDLLMTISDNMVNIGSRYYIEAEVKIFDESGNFISTKALAREAEAQKGMQDAQITGSASSYARKYALSGLFGIDDTKDPDATNTHERAEKPGRLADDKDIQQDLKDNGYDPDAIYNRLIEEFGLIDSLDKLNIMKDRVKKNREIIGMPKDLSDDIKNRFATLHKYFTEKNNG